MTKPELLAPAGSLESMRSAITAGADAVYIGGTKFGARAFAENPDCDGLIEAINFCHFHNRKLYLTVNTLFKEDELKTGLYDFLCPLYDEGLDAVIVQDYGVMAFIRDNFPALSIHASTQSAVHSYYGARLLKDIGVCRVVLPREASLSDVKDVIARGGIESEVFIHGALCYCISGQCLMSSLIGGRSGNRGRCAQVCRLPFPEEHLLNLKDLNTLNILPDIIDTGVTSLKIEGRMKSPRYTAGVTSIYRKYIDLYVDKYNEAFALADKTLSRSEQIEFARKTARESYKVSKKDIHVLNELFDRGGTTTGYFTRHNGKDMIYKGDKPEKRIVDEAVLSKIDELYIDKKLEERVSAKAKLIPGAPAYMELSDGEYIVKVKGDIVQNAESKPLEKEDVLTRLSKFGGTGFTLEKIDLELGEGAFMPVSAINNLRRLAVSELTKEKINGYKRTHL